MIRIRSKVAGFRRCGISHPAEWVEHPDDAFAPEQLEILAAEPMLQVEIVPDTSEQSVEAGDEGRKPSRKPKE